jgi:hypothetical protein
MRAFVAGLLTAAAFFPALALSRDLPRDLFDTARPVSGATPFPDYDPYRLHQLYDKRHEVQLQMFDVINEAAVRRDKKMKQMLDLFASDLGYIPSLAAAHYKYVFGDTAQLDWLLAEDVKNGLGRDSLTLIVFGYMDEWDKTIRRFKEHEKVADGASAEVLHEAIEIRKRLYGAERFEKALEVCYDK